MGNHRDRSGGRIVVDSFRQHAVEHDKRRARIQFFGNFGMFSSLRLGFEFRHGKFPEQALFIVLEHVEQGNVFQLSNGDEVYREHLLWMPEFMGKIKKR